MYCSCSALAKIVANCFISFHFIQQYTKDKFSKKHMFTKVALTSFLIWPFSKLQEEIYREANRLRLRDKPILAEIFLFNSGFYFCKIGDWRADRPIENTRKLSIHTLNMQDYFFSTHACFTGLHSVAQSALFAVFP